MKITWYIATGYSGGISDSPTAPFHFAYVYKHDAQRLNVFMNGVLTTIGNIEINRAAYNVQIGITGKTFDQFRIYDGLARWDSNFTVPDIDDYALPVKKFSVQSGGTYILESRAAFQNEVATPLPMILGTDAQVTEGALWLDWS